MIWNGRLPISRIRCPLERISVLQRRSFGERQHFEEEHHLARSLSKQRLSPEQIEKWKRSLPRPKSNVWKLSAEWLTRQPGYELDALEEIHKRSHNGANVLLEIRDARLPASCHHPSFTRLAKHRRHLICYTHADLLDTTTRDEIEQWTMRNWPQSRPIFVDTRENRPDLQFDIVYDSLLSHLEERGGKNVALTVGCANTGKSSLLLALLRTAKARGDIPKRTKEAVTTNNNKKKTLQKTQPIAITDKPGKTRVLTEYLLRETPRTYFLDVPGVSPPPFFFAERPQAWYAFGAANLLPPNSRLDNDLHVRISLCDYVLYAMNRDGCFEYVSRLQLDGPTDDINVVLEHVPTRHVSNDDPETALLKRCANFLKYFSTGNFGPVVLDDLSQPYQPFVFRNEHFSHRRRSGDPPTTFQEDDFEFK